LTHTEALEVLDTTFPHDKPQMLYWNVQSEMDGEAVIEITYFTSGISWSADYVGICDEAESALSVEGFVRVSNGSGEDYENAQVRLVVGTINLTEKIAALAQLPMSKVEEMDKGKRDELRFLAAKELAAPASSGLGGGAVADAPAPKDIIKEGLSEYFIYTIEGTETIPNGWSKRMRSFSGQDVPLRIQYRYRPREYGEELVRMYLLTNNEESKLGTTPLPDGVFRAFRDNGRDGLSYLTQQSLKYIPIGDKIELNLGENPEVIFELVKRRSYRDSLWMQIHGTDTFRQVDSESTQSEVNSSVVGWDDHGIYSQRIRNYTDKPIDVEIRRWY